MTALVNACGTGNLRSVELLLGHGADPEIEDHYGRTALQFAMHNGHADVIEFLLGGGPSRAAESL
jgi:ankyrin repeat protein